MRSPFRGKLVRRLCSSTLLILVCGVATRPAHACTPAPETPWFTTEAHTLSTNLPGVISTADGEGGTVVLQNGASSMIRIILSGTYQAKGGFEEVAPGDSAILSTDPWSDSLAVDGYTITYLEPRNVLADNRPANPPLPDAQIAWVQVLQDQQSYYIQLRIDYRLNDHYIPDSVDAYEHFHCPSLIDAPALTSIGGLFLGAGLILIPIILISGLRGRRKPSTDDSGSENRMQP